MSLLCLDVWSFFFCFVFTHSKIEVYLNWLTSRWSSSSSCYDAEIDTGDLKPKYNYVTEVTLNTNTNTATATTNNTFVSYLRQIIKFKLQILFF